MTDRRPTPAPSPPRYSVTSTTAAIEIGVSPRALTESSLLGMVGWLWLVALAYAVTWMWAVGVGPRPGEELPWFQLALPQVLAFGGLGASLLRDLPRARWPAPAPSRRRTWWLVALGWPALPFVAVVWLRDRRLREAGTASSQAIDGAWLRLIDLPRIAALRFVAWAAIADLLDTVLIGLHLGWSTETVAVMALLGVSILGPLAATLHGWGHTLLQPELIAAPRDDPPEFRRTDELRPRLFVNAAGAVAGAVAAPLCAGHLWLSSLGADFSRDVLLWGGIVCFAASMTGVWFVVDALHRDVGRASRQVAVVAAGQAPPPLSLASFSNGEMRELVQAVDQLVQRITEANVTKYIAIEKAKEADRLKSQFLANMSHDLRSPLNSIIGFSELLLSGIDGELKAEQRELVEPIHRGGRRLLQEIDDILDTAKIEASRLDLHPEPTPANAIVSRAIEAARKRDSSARFETESAAGIPPVFVDPMRAVQALENVLLFAAERVEGERVRIAIRTGNAGHQRVVTIQVRTPVRPATAEQLAQARRGFYRIPGHRGLGLGLPLAGAILELSGGSLSIEDLDDGMIFALALPAPHPRRARPTPPPLSRPPS